ncbi:hypothetical protein LTR85_011098 [Meristemomyces frigidus]|nr:hypothetical protein LTR85_011098 [Meristemomyces frigidus]
MKDLLLCQRTSQGWRYAVQASMKLRRALFLEAEPSNFVKTWYFDASDEDDLKIVHSPPDPSKTGILAVRPSRLNRMLFIYDRSTHHHNSIVINYTRSYARLILRAPLDPFFKDLPSEASCRGMHIAQPPCREVQVFCAFSVAGDGWPVEQSEQSTIVRDGGVTYGELLDSVARTLDTHRKRKERIVFRECVVSAIGAVFPSPNERRKVEAMEEYGLQFDDEDDEVDV